MAQYSLFGLTPNSPSSAKKAKRPRPISKRAFFFGMGTSLYAIASLMDLISYWSNVNDEEDDELNDSLTENASPMAALASFCYIIMSILALAATPSSLPPPSSRRHAVKKTHYKHPWWQNFLEDHLEVRAEYTLQVFFLIGSILLFAAEELKTHKLMRSLRKQQRASQYSFIISLHLFWLATYGLYKIIPTESDVTKEKTTEEQEEEQDGKQIATPAASSSHYYEGSLEKCGRLFLIMGTTIELSMIYVEYFSQAKVSTPTILMGTFVSALFWWTNALLVGMTERYYYPDSLDNTAFGNSDNNNIVDFSFEDAMNLPDRLRQRMQAHRRHVTHIRVV